VSLLPETVRRIDQLTAETQAAGQVPTLLAGVVRNGSLVHLSVAGGTDPARPQGAGESDADVQYRIGSITKTLTAVLVLQLRDQGKLGLDDPLERHLPDTVAGTTTLRQLLAHAGGLYREPAGPWWERSPGVDLEKLLATLAADTVDGLPTHRYHYSNVAYALLGALLERKTGQSWWDLTRTNLLLPLGMTRTSYLPQEPYARGYVVHPWHGTLREEPRTDTGAMAPAGQLWSTAADLARWAAFLADPAPEVLDAGTLAEMCAPQVMSDLDSWTAGHGLGLELFREGDRVYVGHSGSMPGYVALVMVHRPSRTGIVAFANAYGFRSGSIVAFGRRLLTTVLDLEPAPVRPWRPTASLPPAAAELTGIWWWMGRGYEVSWDDDRSELVVRILFPVGGVPWRFTAEGPDRWRGRSGMNEGEVLTVRRDASGAVVALEVATFVFTRHPDDLG